MWKLSMTYGDVRHVQAYKTGTLKVVEIFVKEEKSRMGSTISYYTNSFRINNVELKIRCGLTL